MTTTFASLLTLLLPLGAAVPVAAADFTDPTWPCVQRKVARLSTGIMWPYPIEPVQLSSKTQAAVQDLVGRFTLRRVELAALEPRLQEFTAAHGNDLDLLGHVFDEAFRQMSITRSKIIKGIGDYSLKQIALSEKIEATRVEMSELLDSENPDFDRVDELEEQLDWDERIYQDRAKSLTYVCESPVIIEKRLYAIAQMLLAQAGN